MKVRLPFSILAVSVLLLVFASCAGPGEESPDQPLASSSEPEVEAVEPDTDSQPEEAPVIEAGPIIASGEMISFAKADGSNPADPANQDRISDNVILTRGNDGGQIYNIAVENQANARTSPAGTLWALGTTENLASLDFKALSRSGEQTERSGRQEPGALSRRQRYLYRYRVHQLVRGEGRRLRV
jgi:hypothetical protein